MAALSLRTLSPILQVASVCGLLTLGGRGCEREQRVLRAEARGDRKSATIVFERGSSDIGAEILPALDAIAGRGSSDLSVRVLIVGFANERVLLTENLDLAAGRGHSVAEHLALRGVARRQIVVVAREAPPDDPAGARCDVEILEASSRVNGSYGDRVASL